MIEPDNVAHGPRRLWILLAAIATFGLALRIWAGIGALWLDEAWSATFAHDVRTPLGVFLAINHDNNHHLNTLWLQVVGWGAPPLLARALSIVCSTLTVLVAGLVGARRGMATAAVTAGLFAVSPILLTYGAEARGYAPMLLALLVAVLLVDRRLSDESGWSPARMLGILAILGTLSHLAMLFGIAALTGWVALVEVRRRPLLSATIATLRLMGGMIVAAAAVVGFIAYAAAISPAGFQVGSYLPFSLASFGDGLERMFAYAIGFPFQLQPLLIVSVLMVVPFAIWLMPSLRPRAPLYLLGIIGLPLAILVFRIGNSGIARYYIVSAVFFLLLLGEVAGAALSGAMVSRRVAIVALGCMAIGIATIDSMIIANRRADPGEALRVMMARAPEGATVIIGHPRDSAVLQVGAATSRYPLRATTNACASARFLYLEDGVSALFPARPAYCGKFYRPVARRIARGLSGLHWQLYERERS